MFTGGSSLPDPKGLPTIIPEHAPVPASLPATSSLMTDLTTFPATIDMLVVG